MTKSLLSSHPPVKNSAAGGARDAPKTILELTGAARDANHDNVLLLEKCRTSMDCAPQTIRQLEWLGEMLGKSKAGVVAKSLNIFHQLATMHERGQQIIMYDLSGRKSMILPSLAAFNSTNRACDEASTRLSFEIPARGVHELEALRELTGEAKKADVIRQAIHLTWTLLHNVEDGHSVVVKEDDGTDYELFMPSSHDDKQAKLVE